MTWKFCSVYGCGNSEKKKIACIKGCKKSHSKEKCPHGKKHPELQNVFFFPFPKDPQLRMKWFAFLRRKDIKSVKHITSNHMVCSVHFQGGLGYCKADPFPTIYNDPVMASRFNSTTKKREAPISRSSSVQVKRKLCFEKNTETTNASKEVSPGTGFVDADDKIIPQHEGLSVASVGEESAMEELQLPAFHHYESAGNFDHTYASSKCEFGTQTLLSSEDIEKQQEEIARLKAKLEDTTTLRRELFIDQATKDDSAVRFYTGIPTLALLLSIFNILKPAAEKMKYWVKGESTKTGKYMVRIILFLSLFCIIITFEVYVPEYERGLHT